MNAIKISNTPIRQHNSLYSLNDLHKAAGGSAKHKPSNWLRNQQTIELIDEINQVSNMRLAIESIHGGRNNGTYVCEELVISYGMWINASFALQVIRCFLAKEKANQKLTPEQKHQIQAAVNERHRRTGEHWQTIYTKLHAFCNVNSYHEIKAEQFQTALNYLASMQNAPEVATATEQIPYLIHLVKYGMYLSQFVLKYHPALKMLNPNFGGELYSQAEHAYIAAYSIAKQIKYPMPNIACWQQYPFGDSCDKKEQFRALNMD